ncbi:alcohol dehydrogenase catalytic domain-containing protein [Leuconostoc mesenteroides]|uniref:alcohol dehydrogenase catalytic domain-containing protein n=1 Tax=Leuconostoc mesenteroides TaxID=1245 RepID=UPI0021A33EF8|nr:alcohol dehydrogenase catalytic domain-containing protein [Leuconostoc mesenteroides]MCT3053867.1 ribitol-5-phosphate dehydrogenase [Leuconostoc mesenteroides]
MLNNVYRLVAPKLIEKVILDEKIDSNTVIVRPTYLSICHADQRYYNGMRDKETLNKKLPMALIHEGVGIVIKDYSGVFKSGERVNIIPNTPFDHDVIVQENYLPSSRFRSSGYDGLMQEYVFARRDRLIKVPEAVPSNVAAYTEMISVAMHSIKQLQSIANEDQEVFGIWGDGNLGYITAVLLKTLYPNSKLFIFGKNERKLEMFSFADRSFTIESVPKNIRVSNAFEATGGQGSKDAINQIIKLVKPQGAIALMGVSENPVEINTRSILEKGLKLSGTSRSSAKDFEDTVQLLNENEAARKQLEILIGIESTVKNLHDIQAFFEADLANAWGKSVMKWEI